MEQIRHYEHRHISHQSTHDKLWGWFVMSSDDTRQRARTYYGHRWCWCWWAHTGKTISVQRHLYSTHQMSQLAARKQRNGYVELTADDLESRWPDFKEQLDQRMLFELLRNDIQA